MICSVALLMEMPSGEGIIDTPSSPDRLTLTDVMSNFGVLWPAAVTRAMARLVEARIVATGGLLLRSTSFARSQLACRRHPDAQIGGRGRVRRPPALSWRG